MESFMSRLMQCTWTGKAIHWNQQDAQKTCNRINKHNRTQVFCYRCKKCTYFHLAKTKKKREKPDEGLSS